MVRRVVDKTASPANHSLTLERGLRVLRVLADHPDGLSVSAQNVKIITANGRVTLRGPVESDDERRIVEELAVAATSAGSVDNQIEVKKP